VEVVFQVSTALGSSQKSLRLEHWSLCMNGISTTNNPVFDSWDWFCWCFLARGLAAVSVFFCYTNWRAGLKALRSKAFNLFFGFGTKK